MEVSPSIANHWIGIVNEKIKILSVEIDSISKKRSPKWISEAGLEWLYRMVRDPKRLWKRYLLESLPFFRLIFLQKLGLYQTIKTNALNNDNRLLLFFQVANKSNS